jgi:methionyl-tRNA formyltransferase
MLRVFIITLDEPVYAPVYLTKILAAVDHRIVGLTALPAASQIGTWGLVRNRMAVYGPLDVLRAVAIYGRCRLRAALPRRGGGRFYSVARLAKEEGVPVIPGRDVNAPGYIETLRGLGIDVLVSVAANQRFGDELLALPRLACLNVHSALLPNYRGMDGLFWALAHGETEVGVTVHEMSPGIDQGPIVAQAPFPVRTEEPLHRVYYRAMDHGAVLLARALDGYADGAVTLRPNPADEGRTFSWPTREAARRFREQGHRFF